MSAFVKDEKREEKEKEKEKKERETQKRNLLMGLSKDSSKSSDHPQSNMIRNPSISRILQTGPSSFIPRSGVKRI